jgi:hypothetical protein
MEKGYELFTGGVMAKTRPAQRGTPMPHTPQSICNVVRENSIILDLDSTAHAERGVKILPVAVGAWTDESLACLPGNPEMLVDVAISGTEPVEAICADKSHDPKTAVAGNMVELDSGLYLYVMADDIDRLPNGNLDDIRSAPFYTRYTFREVLVGGMQFRDGSPCDFVTIVNCLSVVIHKSFQKGNNYDFTRAKCKELVSAIPNITRDEMLGRKVDEVTEGAS